MKIKKVLRGLLPYGVVRLYQNKRAKHSEHLFWENFLDYVKRGNYCDFIPQSPFKTIVAVHGFGYTGSGAVIDLLREYEHVLVLGSVDIEGTLTSASKRFEEIDLLRIAGGLFEVERFLGVGNVYQQDALLHRVIFLIQKSKLYIENEFIRLYFYEFLRRISYVFINRSFGQTYNRHLNYNGINDIILLKDLRIDEYREICRQLLNSIFTCLKGQSTASFLVLDQFLNDREYDMERYKAYVPNLKLISVYRDPRDVYAYALKETGGWIPHSSVDEFIQWYKLTTARFNINEKNKYLSLQFEQLVNNYESIVKQIEFYLNLQAENHIHAKECLDVMESQKNVYLWKQDFANLMQYEVISKKLSNMCYTE